MASTSLTLGPHWESFIREEVASGRYASASDVVRAALRELEERTSKLETLRSHLSEGAHQAARGEFVRSSPTDVMRRAKTRAAKRKA